MSKLVTIDNEFCSRIIMMGNWLELVYFPHEAPPSFEEYVINCCKDSQRLLNIYNPKGLTVDEYNAERYKEYVAYCDTMAGFMKIGEKVRMSLLSEGCIKLTRKEPCLPHSGDTEAWFSFMYEKNWYGKILSVQAHLYAIRTIHGGTLLDEAHGRDVTREVEHSLLCGEAVFVGDMLTITSSCGSNLLTTRFKVL